MSSLASVPPALDNDGDVPIRVSDRDRSRFVKTASSSHLVILNMWRGHISDLFVEYLSLFEVSSVKYILSVLDHVHSRNYRIRKKKDSLVQTARKLQIISAKYRTSLWTCSERRGEDGSRPWIFFTLIESCIGALHYEYHGEINRRSNSTSLGYFHRSA